MYKKVINLWKFEYVQMMDEAPNENNILELYYNINNPAGLFVLLRRNSGCHDASVISWRIGQYSSFTTAYTFAFS